DLKQELMMPGLQFAMEGRGLDELVLRDASGADGLRGGCARRDGEERGERDDPEEGLRARVFDLHAQLLLSVCLLEV
ncbi:MAG TPA: hypothetical protein VHX13_04285, partial [Acidobacteriaceae bacterium]|nr:hypothetical protein [Acidobacteriaceae bacterium]